MTEFFQSWKPDVAGLILGTGFMRFERDGLRGLARCDDAGVLDILAVSSSEPGTGQFRNFMDAAKARFSRIGLWHVWSDGLNATLARYGFHHAETWEAGERILGWEWKKGKLRPRSIMSRVTFLRGKRGNVPPLPNGADAGRAVGALIPAPCDATRPVRTAGG